tara:strand:+ start:4 stop:504 length:501 start_codon:yes stop_codon:yes gene_type:complete
MYILKPEMAEELRETKNKIYQKSPESLTDSNYIATIGDICTIKIFEEIREPNLCIIDMKTKRNIALNSKQKIQISTIGKKTVYVQNKAGTISNELWKSIKNNISNNLNTKIVVDGEEDLATLAVISMVQLGAKVIYGMPNRGMVVVDVNQQEKKRADSLLRRMLVE